MNIYRIHTEETTFHVIAHVIAHDIEAALKKVKDHTLELGINSFVTNVTCIATKDATSSLSQLIV